MSHRITILCENRAQGPLPVIGEHGLAFYLETPAGNYLIDTGQGFGLERNARVLNKPLAAIKALCISHGHYDHTGGLPLLLEHHQQLAVYAHPEIFTPRYALGQDQTRYIGIPYPRDLVQCRGAHLHMHRHSQQLPGGLLISGEIPRTTDFEQGDPKLSVYAPETGYTPDPFADDYSFVLSTAEGPVLLLGCAHAGLVNILYHFEKQWGINHWRAILGGTHLGPADDQQFQQTLAYLQHRVSFDLLGVSHCTGLPRAAALRDHFPQQLCFAQVGSSFSY